MRKTFTDNRLIKTELGVVYTTQIGLGILVGNVIYYGFNYTIGPLTSFVISTIVVFLAGGKLDLFRLPSANIRHDIINSVFISILETILFICVCLSTYLSWFYFKNKIF